MIKVEQINTDPSKWTYVICHKDYILAIAHIDRTIASYDALKAYAEQIGFNVSDLTFTCIGFNQVNITYEQTRDS